MSLSQAEIAEVVLAQVPEARRAQPVVYLDPAVKAAGSEIDYKKVRLESPNMVGFIDLEPEMNWGHPCRYVPVNPESGLHREIDAPFPPFLRASPPYLIVLFKGDEVPDWAVNNPNQPNHNEHTHQENISSKNKVGAEHAIKARRLRFALIRGACAERCGTPDYAVLEKLQSPYSTRGVA